jgi:DNA-directed RNA polymerase specialized sigma24 family protein
MQKRILECIAANQSDPLDHAELGRAIAALDSERRMILALFYVERLNLDEIALVLDTSEDQVAEMFYRAMEGVGACPPWESMQLAAA